jgi:FtsH-binding integral membrane protein
LLQKNKYNKNYVEDVMTEETKAKLLKIFLIITGLFFIFGVFAMMNYIMPESWGWEPRQSEYEQMIVIIYATLGVFLILAAKNPSEHRSLLWFTVWSSITHGGVMLYQALVSGGHEHANLIGDVPALFAVAIVLWFLMPKHKTM